MAADFNLKAALELTPESLRAIQTDINNAMRQISPKLELDIPNLKDLLKGFDVIKANISELSISEAAKNGLARVLEEVANVRINKITPSPHAKAELKRELEDLAIEFQKAEIRRGAAGGAGVSQEERSAAVKESEEARAKLVDVLNRIVEVSEREQKIIQRNEVLAQETYNASQKIRDSRIREAELIAEEVAREEERGFALDAKLNSYIEVLEKRNRRINRELIEIQKGVDEREQKLDIAMDKLISDLTKNKIKTDTKKLESLSREFEKNQTALNKAVDDERKSREKDASLDIQLDAYIEKLKARNAKFNLALISAQEAADKRILNEKVKTFSLQTKLNETYNKLAEAQDNLVRRVEEEIAARRIIPGGQKNDFGAALSRAGASISKTSQKFSSSLLSNIGEFENSLVRGSVSALKFVGAIDNTSKETREVKLSELRSRVKNLSGSLDFYKKKLDETSKEISKVGAGEFISKSAPGAPKGEAEAKIAEAEKRELSLRGSINSVLDKIAKTRTEIARLVEQERKDAALQSRRSIISERVPEAATQAFNILKAGVNNFVNALNGPSREVRQLRVGSLQKRLDELRNETGNLKDRFEEASRGIKSQFTKTLKRGIFPSELSPEGITNKTIAKHEAQKVELQKQINKNLDEERQLRRELIALEKRSVDEARADANKRAQARAESKVASSRTSNANSITFTGVKDIQSFGKKLDPSSMARFVDVVQQIPKGMQLGATKTAEFIKTLRGAGGPIATIRDNLNSATRSAFQFGEQSTESARRLLAWSGPATFIFSTIGALKSATNTLVDLDTQARRLVFFQSAGEGLRTNELSSGLENLNKNVKEVEANVNLFISTAKRSGIAIQDVVEGTLAASRVGQEFVQTISLQNGELAKTPSKFLETVLSLVRLEGGALKAEDAVNSLNAIDIQFLDRLKEGLQGVELEEFQKQLGTGLANAGALLATVAADAAFSVAELADSTARVGAAFANIQGTGLPQVIALIGKASSATGANVGRLSTALRQILTFSVQNAEVIKKSFGVEIVDTSGAIKGFEAVLSVLRKINELRGTERAVELSKLIGDRRNVGDIQSLATAIAELEKQFGALGSTEAEVALVRFSARKQVEADLLLQDSYSASLNRLTTAFTELANNANLDSILGKVVNFLTDGVSAASAFLDNLNQLKPVLTGLATFALAKVAPQIGAGIAGFVGKAITGNVKEQNIEAIKTQKNLVEAVNAAQRDGLLSEAQSHTLRQRSLGVLRGQKLVEDAIVKTSARLNIAIEEGNASFKERQRLQNKLNLLQKQQNALAIQENNIRTTGEKQIQKTSGLDQFKRGRGKIAALGSVAATAAALLSDTIGKAISDNDDIANGIGEALSRASIGGTIGAQLGAIFGPKGELVGGIVGGIVASASLIPSLVAEALGIQSAFVDRKTEELEAKRKALLAGKEAGEAQRAIIERRQQLEQKQQDVIARTQSEINNLTQRRADIEKEITDESGKQNADLNRIQSLQREAISVEEELDRKKTSIQDEELKREQKRFGIIEQINTLRRKEQLILDELSNAERNLGSLVSERSKIGLSLTVNQAKLTTQIKTLQDRAQVLLEKRALEIKLGASFSDLSQITQEIADIQAESARLQRQKDAESISAAEKTLDLSSREAQEQISAWEEASRNVVSAFEKTAEIQAQLANNFFEAGKATSERLGAMFQNSSKILEEAGASIAERLRAARDIISRRLGAVRSGAERTIGGLRQGAQTPFGSTAELRQSTDRLISLITTATLTANQKIFDEETKTINVRLAQVRQQAADERSLFELRLGQTKREIDIRKQLAEEEISLLRQRQEIERQLSAERIGQQREFGRLLIEGPEKFLEVTRDIKNVRSFFRGIKDVSVEGLRRIGARAASARQGGNFEALQSVARGLESLQKFGGTSPISGISPAQLQSIFERIQVVMPEEISKDLKAQQDELNGQTIIQQQIEARERQQQALLEAETALSEAQLRIESAAQDAAIKQRDAIIGLMDQAVKEQKQSVVELVKLQQLEKINLLKFAEGASPDVENQIREFIVNSETAFRNALGKVEADKAALSAAENTPLTESLNESTRAVDFFNSKLFEIAGVQERFSNALKTPESAAPGQTSTVRGGAQEAVDRINELVSRTVNGSVRIGRSDEFRRLEEAIERNGGSAAQRARLEELRRTELRPESFNRRDTEGLSRRLLNDQTIRGGLEQGFRTLLQNGVGGQSDLVRQLAEARGTGARGARALDPQTIRDILGRSGLSSLANDIDSRGEAVEVVDRLLKFSEELNRVPDRFSENAARILSQILSVELKENFKEVTDIIAAQREQFTIGERDQTRFSPELFREGLQQAFREFRSSSERLPEIFREAFAGENLGGQIGDVIVEKIKNQPIKIDLPELQLKLNAELISQIDGEKFLTDLTTVLADQGISREELVRLRDSIKRIVDVMVATGQIRPE